MAYDDVLTRNDNDELAVRVVSATETSNNVNPNDVYTRDSNGNLAVRTVGGGGNSHFLGSFATPQALQEAYPTAEAGDFAIVESTDTVWVWDTDTSAWVDSDRKGQVTSVNGQTGAVTVQETLVNQTNIKSVNGNSLLGSGNLELSTFLPFPSGWTTNSTTKAFCDGVAADTTAVKGKAYLGEVTFSDLPASMINGEVNVYINDSGSQASDKVIVLELTSGNTSPYKWQYTYWDGGNNVSGWKTWQEPLVSGTNIKTINGTTLLGSGDITTEAIQVSTMPTAGVDELGNVYQFIGTTNANYTHGYFYECVSDGGNPATYSWVQMNVQPTPSGLPSQTGQSGKFLTTDGTDASWSDKPLVNTGTQTDSLTILGVAEKNSYTVNIGKSSGYSGVTGNAVYSVFVGYNAKTTLYAGTQYSVCLGYYAEVNRACVAVGAYAKASYGPGIAIGYRAEATAANAIQIGAKSTSIGYTNSTANTLKVGNENGNYEMMSADGTIPTDRFTTTPVADGSYVPTLTISSGVATRSWTTPASAPVVPETMPTLAVADWSSSNTQTVNVTGVTASNIVFVSPAPASASDYASAGIVCTAQGSGTLTFECTTTPTNAITVNVVILG